MKESIRLFVQNMSMENRVEIHVWTFTESTKGCFISKSPVVSLEALAKYVQDIKLCRPPDDPTVDADGGDGPENILAATATLEESFADGTQILCFI